MERIMRGVRGANVALAVLMGATFVGGGLAEAQSSPSRPDYLFRLPERQWAVGSTLAGERGRCEPGVCEAGYHAGDLVLSVRRSGTYLQAVAAVRGCEAVASRTIKPTDLTGLSPADQWNVISRATLNAARVARNHCSPGVTDLIDTAALVNIVPGYGWPS
jgi:hypothetical protein